MFVFNLKIDRNKIFKIVFTLIGLAVTAILVLVINKVMFNNTVSSNYKSSESSVSTLSTSNYTNVLKSVHDNVDNYIGKQISFSGYVYRLYDFDDIQFVLARDMLINSNMQTLVVGFLCESPESKNFENNTWVNITGTIEKGDYHGEIPIIKVTSIEKIQKPNDEFVYPPDDFYIPTSAI